jgi:hypothetical protein
MPKNQRGCPRAVGDGGAMDGWVAMTCLLWGRVWGGYDEDDRNFTE